MSKRTMYEIGLSTKTDKITHHRYDRFYPIFLDKFRDQEIIMCEIGLWHCESIKMWKEYFPKAKIFGVDNNKNLKCDDIEVIYADQNSKKDLENISNTIGKCDFIIDDGSHHPQHQYDTFIKLFDCSLKFGGIYIIEDIECNYWRSGSSIYGNKISDDRPLFKFFEQSHYLINQEFTKKNNFLEISTVTFAHNCIIVTKRNEEELSLCKREYRLRKNL